MFQMPTTPEMMQRGYSIDVLLKGSGASMEPRFGDITASGVSGVDNDKQEKKRLGSHVERYNTHAPAKGGSGELPSIIEAKRNSGGELMERRDSLRVPAV